MFVEFTSQKSRKHKDCEVLTMLQSLLRLLSNEEEECSAVEQLDVSFHPKMGLGRQHCRLTICRLVEFVKSKYQACPGFGHVCEEVHSLQ